MLSDSSLRFWRIFLKNRNLIAGWATFASTDFTFILNKKRFMENIIFKEQTQNHNS